MQASSPNSDSTKFTRGEKCLFTHVVITFSGILAIIILYYIHACLLCKSRVPLSLVLRASDPEPTECPKVMEYPCVGAAYVALEDGEWRAACSTAALRTHWSLVSARCVAARASPHLVHLLPRWKLLYSHYSTGVRRGMLPPEYGRGDGAVADIGLFEHEEAMTISAHDKPVLCSVPSETRRALTSDSVDLLIIGWQKRDQEKSSNKGSGEQRAALASVLPAAQCTSLVAPVTSVAASSLCLMLHLCPMAAPPTPLIGSMVFEGTQLVGITSWGNGTENRLPIVVTQIAPFKHWLENSMKLFL